MEYHKFYTDEEVRDFLKVTGYEIDNETDLAEHAVNEGFKWNDEVGKWQSTFGN